MWICQPYTPSPSSDRGDLAILLVTKIYAMYHKRASEVIWASWKIREAHRTVLTFNYMREITV